MRTALFVLLLLAASTNAEAVECPDSFPTKDISLADNPKGRTGFARLQPARLSNAYMTSGELYSEVQFIPDITNVKGGRNIRYTFSPHEKNWLVCEYGGGERIGGTIQWWEKVDPKLTECELKVREVKVRGTASDWTASAACK